MKVVIDPGAKAPHRAHAGDAGLDLFAAEDVVIAPDNYVAIDTGTHVQIPFGYVGLLTSKSGLMAKNGITCRGTIDCGYTGSIRAVLFNHGTEPFEVHHGDKVTQLVILPCALPEVELVDHLEETDRGDSGFGSTGR